MYSMMMLELSQSSTSVRAMSSTPSSTGLELDVGVLRRQLAAGVDERRVAQFGCSVMSQRHGRETAMRRMWGRNSARGDVAGRRWWPRGWWDALRGRPPLLAEWRTAA
jgi:hypothetical protein